MRNLVVALLISLPLFGQVQSGLDVLFLEENPPLLCGKRVGLITNHTALDSHQCTAIELFKRHAKKYQLVALFGPEHGIRGAGRAYEHIHHDQDEDGIPIYSLHGETRRPTEEMLKDIDVLVFDIQDIGVRCYTYISTLFYVMEEAAKRRIQVVVLDRPNPINGITVDGPPTQKSVRSFVGYIDIPLVHGMTVGELARYFNNEHAVECDLVVVPMRGWKRTMSFADTHLTWIPTSPQIPEADTPIYYPATNILGESLKNVQIGVGYTLPFKLVAAPWIDATKFAAELNKQNFPGVRFVPHHFSPYFGRFMEQECHGVLIVVTDPCTYHPVATQFLLLGVIKSLYPKQFEEGLTTKPEMLNKIIGSDQAYPIMKEKKYIAWELISLHQEERNAFLLKRQKYLLY